MKDETSYGWWYCLESIMNESTTWFTVTGTVIAGPYLVGLFFFRFCWMLLTLRSFELAKLLIVYSLPHTFCLEISFVILCSIYHSPAAFPSSKQVHHCQCLGLLVVKLHKNCFEIKYASCLVEYIKQTQVLSKDMPRLLKSLLDCSKQ